MLGTGESSHFLERSHKVQGTPETQIVSLYTDAYGRIMILTAEGEVYAWGKNNNNAPLGIGVGSPASVATPTRIGGAVEGKKIVEFLVSRTGRVLALDSEGVVYEWGGSSYGFPAIHAPVQKAGALEGVTVKKIFVHTSGAMFALSHEGKVYSWGNGYSGVLGTGTHTNAHVPEPIQLEGDITDASIQSLFVGLNETVFALDESGALYAWGQSASS